MELGNLILGHSRGKFPIKDRHEYLEILQPLFSALDCDNYGIKFNNDVFEMNPYCWCEDTNCPQCSLGTQCNLFHKPSGLRLSWYKYALRDSYTNIELDVELFTDIIDDCLRSVGVDDDALTIHINGVTKPLTPEDAAKKFKAMRQTMNINAVYGKHVSPPSNHSPMTLTSLCRVKKEPE